MKKRWVVGLSVLAVATATLVPIYRGTRSAGPRIAPLMSVSTHFDPKQSAALFVGVRKFDGDKTLDVPYAVDDAIDLAYKFAIDVGLVPPGRVVLALSGKAQKPESQQRLAELRRLGAVETKGGQSDILAQLERQSARAGRDGILIVSFSTHGYMRAGNPYILGSSSLYEHEETALQAMSLFDIIARSDAARSLVLVDACRDRVTTAVRAGTSDPTTVAPAIANRMAKMNGQVILYAAAAGKYAYDDEESGNGVFTKAVLDGLACDAAAPRGIVTAETLHRYVERRVHRWILKNRRQANDPATQISTDGRTEDMPLCQCWKETRDPGGPSRVSFDGETLTALAGNGNTLWQRNLGAPIARAELADLDADGRQEVVAGTANAIVTFDASGKPGWPADEGMPLRAFAIADRFRKRTKQVVSLWHTRLTIHDAGGKRLFAYDHDAPLQHLAIGRETTRHAPKIVVTAGAEVLLFNPNKEKPLWRGVLSERIERLTIVDFNHDGRAEIALRTRSGTIHVDFEGNANGDRRFTLVRRGK